MDFPNIELEAGNLWPSPIGEQLKQAAVTWRCGWIRKAWGEDNRSLSKAVHNIEDARRAEKHGAAAIVVSNHGGRQVDGTPATLHCYRRLPAVRADGSTMKSILMAG